MFGYLYQLIKTYFDDKTQYKLPFNISDIEQDELFNNFKGSDIELNKTIFALNNIPDIIHKILFTDYYICEKYYYITLKLNPSKIIDVYHNLIDINDSFLDDKIKYIYIRVNVITKTSYKNMQHVNCIIIDKNNKHILFFEPKLTFMYDVSVLTSLIDNCMDTSTYKKLFPQDIGYNILNQLQRYDTYCQTYVIFIFSLIIHNQAIEYKDYHQMFNKSITTKNIGYYLFNIYRKLREYNYEICIQPLIWNYPDSTNIFKTLKLYFNKNDDTKEEKINNIVIEYESDFTMVSIS